MAIFTIQKTSLKKLANLQIAKLTPLIMLIVLSGLIFANEYKNGEILADKNFVLIIIGVLLTILITGLINGRNTIMKILAETTFNISDNYIEKTAPNAAPIKISFRDVRAVKTSNTGIYLKSKHNSLQIPRAMENYEQMQKLIRAKTNQGISYNDAKFQFNETLLSYTISIVLLILGITLIKLNNPIHKLYVAIPLVILLSAGVVKINIDKHTPYEITRYTPKVVLLILAICGYMVYLFTKA